VAPFILLLIDSDSAILLGFTKMTKPLAEMVFARRNDWKEVDLVTLEPIKKDASLLYGACENGALATAGFFFGSAFVKIISTVFWTL